MKNFDKASATIETSNDQDLYESIITPDNANAIYIRSLKRRIDFLEQLVRLYTTRSKERFEHDLQIHTMRALTCKQHLLPSFLMQYDEEWFMTENETKFKLAVAQAVYRIVLQRDKTLYSFPIESILEGTHYGKCLLADMIEEFDANDNDD